MATDGQPAERGRAEPTEIDELDRAIIAELQQDGRATYRAIGKAIGVPEATVRFRVNRMQRSGLISVTVFAHPGRLGGGVLASLMVRVTAPRRAAVVEELQSWDQIMYLSSCLGRSDLLLQVMTRSLGELEEELMPRLAGLDGVQDVEALVEVKLHKANYKLPISML